MSQVNVGAVGNLAGTASVPSDTVINGSAKAWCMASATAGTIRRSFNIASFTKVAAGNYLFTLTNPVASIDSVVVSDNGYNTGIGTVDLSVTATRARMESTSTLRMLAYNTSTNQTYDHVQAGFAVFG